MILEITEEQLEKAHRAREAALEKDPKYRAFDEEMKNLASRAARQREPGGTESPTSTFELTPRRAHFQSPSGSCWLDLFGLGCRYKYRGSFDSMYAADEVLFRAETAGDPSADYTDDPTRMHVPHVVLTVSLASLEAHKDLALIFRFDPDAKGRVLVFTDAGKVGDKTLEYPDRQFLIAVGSLKWYVRLYFVCVTPKLGGAGDWYFQGVTGYVI